MSRTYKPVKWRKPILTLNHQRDIVLSLLFKLWRNKKLPFYWILGPCLSFIVFLPSLVTYFSGEDFIFINFASSGHAFFEPSQNLFYRPLPNIFWQFDYNVWHLNASGYHFTNIVIHIVNTFLIELLVLSISSNKTIAVFACLLFAIQPIHTEPVVWLSGRPDLLATLFFISAFLSGLKFFRTNNWKYYLISVLSFTLSLLCKESGIGFPIIFFLILVTGYRQRFPQKLIPLVIKFIPYFLIIAIYIVVRIIVLGGLGGYAQESTSILGVIWNLTLGLWLPLLFPINLESAGLVISLVTAGLFGIAYIWVFFPFPFKTVNHTKHNILVGVLIMYGTILPALTVAPTGRNLEQSRILYLPSVGFCIVLASLFHLNSNKSSDSMNYKAKKEGNFFGKIKPHTHSKIKFVLIMLMYIICLIIAIIPWIHAGDTVEETFILLKKSGLPIQSGDTVYYQSLPDSYHGAYVWRNGINEATKLLIKPGVDGFHRTDDLIIDYKRAAQSKIWFIQYGLTQKPITLHLSSSYSITNPSISNINDNNFDKDTKWSFAQCDTDGWILDPADKKIECQKSSGMLFNVMKEESNLLIRSPIINASGTELQLSLESYVYYNFQQPQIEAELTLKDSNGNPNFQQTFQLAADGKNHIYQFQIKNYDMSNNQKQIFIKITNSRSNILLQSARIQLNQIGVKS